MALMRVKRCSACNKDHPIEAKHTYESFPEDLAEFADSLPETKPRKRLVYKGTCKNTGIEVYFDLKTSKML